MTDETLETRQHGSIQVIARAAAMLRALRESPDGLTPGELASRLELPRTTVHRIASALEDEDLIASGRGPRGRYRLGPEIARLAAASTRDIVGLLHPHLVEFSARVNETVDLSLLDGSQVTFVDQVDAPHRLRPASAVGESFPLHSCAPGKALLATLSASRLRALLPARWPAYTAHTITSPQELLDQLDEIRSTGFALDNEEQNDGICAVGVAITLAGQQLAVSVPMPTQRFAAQRDECARLLLEFRKDLESEGL